MNIKHQYHESSTPYFSLGSNSLYRDCCLQERFDYTVKFFKHNNNYYYQYCYQYQHSCRL